MTRHEWLKRIARRFGRRGVGRFILQMGVLFALGTTGAFASETGTNLPWEGPLTTLVTSLTGPVAYAISVIAIVALGATLAEHQPQEHVRVLLDPVGHPFCLCRDDG